MPSSAARERIGAEESKRLSLASERVVFSSRLEGSVGQASACLVLTFGLARNSRQARSLSYYNPRVRERLEYAAAWLLLKTIGAMPRPLARFVGARTAALLFWMRPGLRAPRHGKFEAGISGMEQETAPRGHSRHGAATGMDGGGIRAFSAATRRKISSASCCSTALRISRRRKRAAKESCFSPGT